MHSTGAFLKRMNKQKFSVRKSNPFRCILLER